ncbi:helix-turn-helix-type transcriptional regulator [Pseudomonas frederiksbergensis]|uniref:Helix-turn-helix-type transcriptional regulator n=1 Tax=Pseudomonas frederiksbergensis TaxID=104087 RepID=A0A1J0EIH7_9PSED|nr:MerR family transcriptional regulator [Pseudomonas frederiksbergensis]APC15854.1 helix-turn-helix-type transcriptional regulator [Pseudomonas frederiksbergensis]
MAASTAIHPPPLSITQEQLFPIREVARLTGVNPVTLRAWERRYGLIQPTRTESGHRLYSMTDIERVQSILGWIGRGVAVSKVGKILAKTSDVLALSSIIPDELVQADYAQWQAQITAAVSNFDDVELGRIYGQVFSTYLLTVTFQDIFMPLWTQLLQQQDKFGHVSEWVMLDGFLRARVLQRLVLLRGSQLLRVVVAAIEGHCRELELLLAALYMGSPDLGVRVLALGQPFDELILVCEKIKPHALVLFSNCAPVPDFSHRLNRLAMGLDCRLMLAGDSADLAQESLAGSSIGCIGREGVLMQQRLQQFLAGTLNT